MPAPKKVGKSIAALVHTVDMALAGARIVIFDRENGGDLFAERLEMRFGVAAERKPLEAVSRPLSLVD